MKNILFLSIGLLLTNNIYAQFLAPPTGDDESLIALIKKEDFTSLATVLNNEGFAATKQNYDYDGGTNHVIADLVLTRDLGKIYRQLNSYYGVDMSHWMDATEDISVNYTDDSDCKHLKYTHFYFTCCPLYFLSILRYCSQQQLTSVIEPKKILDKEPERFGSYVNPKWDDSIIASRRSGLNEIEKNKLMRVWDTLSSLDSGHHYIFYHNNIFYKNEWTINTTNVYDVSFWRINQDKPDAKNWYTFSFRMDEYYPVEDAIINVPLIKEGNIYYLYIQIGNNNKKYIFDSGASFISLSEDGYQQFLNENIIHSQPTLQKFSLADGSVIVKKCVRIPEWKMGKITLRNVNAVVVKDGEPLLFGESVLNQFKSWKIDNNTNKLIIEIK